LHQVGDLFQLNVILRCQKVNIILGFTGSFCIAGLRERSHVSRIIQIYDYRYVACHFNPLISPLEQDTAQSRLQCNNLHSLLRCQKVNENGRVREWASQILAIQFNQSG